MNELECKVCEEPTSVSEDAVAVTCAGCVNDIISGLNNTEVS